MNKRSSTILLLALYGTLLFNYGPSAPAHEPEVNPPPAGQSSSQPPETIAAACKVDENLECPAKCRPFCPSQDFTDTLSGYFGPEVSVTAANGSDPLGVPAAVKDQHKLQFIIITVPDPAHTRLSLFFDESVDAVEQAATDAGYLFARAAIPWPDAQHPEPSNFATRIEEKDYKRAKEKIPGLMIFRNTKGNGIKESLLVFLVGELPTEGINKQQFHNALRAIQLMSPPAGQGGSWLRIVGPTFSGSLYSLNEIFEHDDTAKSFLPHVEMLSGTVRDPQTIKWFKNRPNRYKFQALHEDDFGAMLQFEKFVCRLGYPRNSIARLSEDETAYGGEGHKPDSDGANPRKKVVTCPGKIPKLHFPRDIASLRAAYEQELRRQEITEAQGKRPPRTSLRLSLEDTGSDDDSIATYSRAQTPLSEDEVLKGIVSELRANRTRFIELRATSTLDLLFLTRYLQSAYPQGRIVSAIANRLFDADAGGSSMRGMFALASPPLWDRQAAHDFATRSTRAAHDFNVQASREESVFASTNAADVYTAVRHALLFHFPHTMFPQGPQLLWLTVLGRDGFWPLARLSPAPRNSWMFKISPTISWMFLYFAGIVFAAVYILLCWGGSIRAHTSAMVAFAPVKNATRSWLLCIFAWLILLALLAIFAPALLPGNLSGLSGAVLKVGGWGTIILFGASTFFDLRRREEDHEDASRVARVRQARLWFAAISAALVIFYFTFCLVMLHKHLVAGNLFLYRYIHLSSGVSPLLPWLLILTAGLWWAWYGVKGLVLFDGRRPRLPDEKDFPAKVKLSYIRFLSLCDGANQMLLKAASPLTRNVWAYIPGLAGAAIIFLVLATQSSLHLMVIQGLDAWWVDIVYELALGLVLFGIVCTLMQMELTWVASRNLLRGLDRLPLRRGFNELKEFSWSPIWQLSAGGENDLNTIFMREMESLAHLRNTPELASKNPAFAASIEESQRCLDNLLKEFAPIGAKQDGEASPGAEARNPAWRRWLQGRKEKASEESKRISTFENLRTQLASTCGEGLKALLLIWEKENGLISSERADAVKEDQESTPLPPYVKVTEQFVCLVFMNYIFMALRQIRNLVTIVAGMFVFVALSLSSYPFEPKTTLRSFMLLLLSALAAAAAFVYAQMHRDPILSRITGTSPGKLGGDFWLRLGSAVGLPLLGLLAYQFPQVGNLLFSWLEPALQAIK